MALKATIYKAKLQIADMDRGLYVDHAVTLARHPSETDERMMVRLVALALWRPADDHQGMLEMAGSVSDTDEPDLWQKDLTGRILHWIDVGQPDDKRILKACGRAERVTVVAYAAGAGIWWQGVAGKLVRARSLAVWRWPAAACAELATLAQRTMQLQVTVQDGTVWVGDGERSVELQPQALLGGADGALR
ncbi:YaeQ family protein [Piscinibacter sakaiensis]|uniref:YaeQ protein n=1 Tax=Piscinibacter sakaiensis TaxID=1547922 RepID=A0A0K8P6W3_PISS1|nr:YaeQ family protein [Piscinibacter sakaiensis]GAP37960.1 YaeQ protein [Piscinibacter sakaiensis]